MSYDRDYKHAKAKDEQTYPNWLSAFMVILVIGIVSTPIFLLGG